MKRLVPFALVALLVLAPAHAPAAPAAEGLTPQQSQELVTTYAHLTSEFYKKVDRQVVLDGARANLIAYLKMHCIANPSVKPMHATDDDERNVRELTNTVSSAIIAYADKIGDHSEKDKACKVSFKKFGEKSGATYINYAAIAGTLGSMKDRYTVFLSPHDYSELNDGLDGTEFGGVGLSYDIDDKTKMIHVQNVILDGPADKAGVQSDDIISSIDGKSVHDAVDGKSADLQTKAVQSMLRGTAGTKVQLTILRDGKQIDPITITRAIIRQPSVYSKLLPGNIGWVQLTVFGLETGHELATALNRLDAEGAKAFILDLRYNGGGYLNAAVDVSSKFISSGPIVTVESRAGTSTEYDAENEAIAPRPLAVLVNAYTASASEITAGAIQDSGVGTLIGTKTFGKGVVQSIYPLGDGSAVKITTARYLTPHGRDINKIGITPDLAAVVPKGLRIRMGDPGNDPQLQDAINFLQGKIAQNAPASTPATATH